MGGFGGSGYGQWPLLLSGGAADAAVKEAMACFQPNSAGLVFAAT